MTQVTALSSYGTPGRRQAFTPVGPAIVTQPAPQSATYGESFLFSVDALSSGGSLSYQWKADGIDIPGETSAIYAGPAFIGLDGALITVEVSDDYFSILSSSALLSVAPVLSATVWNFGVDGLVNDGGLALLITDSPTGSHGLCVGGAAEIVQSSNHAHVFLLEVTETTDVMTLVSVGDSSVDADFSYSVKINATGNIEVTARDELGADVTLTSSIPIAYEAVQFLVIVIRDTGDAEIWIHGVEAGSISGLPVKTLTGEASRVWLYGEWNGALFLEPLKNSIVDYYALLPIECLDLFRLFTAAENSDVIPPGTFTPPTVPTTPPNNPDGNNPIISLVHADFDPPIIKGMDCIDYYQISDLGGGSVLIGVDQGPGVDLQNGAIGTTGSLYVPRHDRDDYYLPYVCPFWSNFHDNNLGVRDWQIEAYVQPSTGFCYLGSSQPYRRQGLSVYPYAGMTIAASGVGEGNGVIQLDIGRSMGSALTLKDGSQAATLTFEFDTGLSTTEFTHIAVVRRDGVFSAYMGGRKYSLVAGEDGTETLPIYNEPSFGKFLFGTKLVSDDGQSLGAHSEEVYIDEFRFLLDVAEYDETFTPPAVAFDDP